MSVNKITDSFTNIIKDVDINGTNLYNNPILDPSFRVRAIYNLPIDIDSIHYGISNPDYIHLYRDVELNDNGNSFTSSDFSDGRGDLASLILTLKFPSIQIPPLLIASINTMLQKLKI